jgi:hypothetical protein
MVFSYLYLLLLFLFFRHIELKFFFLNKHKIFQKKLRSFYFVAIAYYNKGSLPYNFFFYLFEKIISTISIL